MIEVVLNDRLGKKVRVKCNEDDTIGDLKKLVAAQIGECGLYERKEAFLSNPFCMSLQGLVLRRLRYKNGTLFTRTISR